jgi:flagellar biosynthesis/type III secretory pathway protein FliH
MKTKIYIEDFMSKFTLLEEQKEEIKKWFENNLDEVYTAGYDEGKEHGKLES